MSVRSTTHTHAQPSKGRARGGRGVSRETRADDPHHPHQRRVSHSCYTHNTPSSNSGRGAVRLFSYLFFGGDFDAKPLRTTIGTSLELRGTELFDADGPLACANIYLYVRVFLKYQRLVPKGVAHAQTTRLVRQGFNPKYLDWCFAGGGVLPLAHARPTSPG